MAAFRCARQTDRSFKTLSRQRNRLCQNPTVADMVGQDQDQLRVQRLALRVGQPGMRCQKFGIESIVILKVRRLDQCTHAPPHKSATAFFTAVASRNGQRAATT